MKNLDDTTTSMSFDDADEDKTLFLNGTERLRYFRDVNRPQQNPALSARSFLQRLMYKIRRY